MRHHILIPTDYSENAWSAALYAIKLFANEPCTFYFLHAWTFINTGSRTYISPKYIDDLKDASKSQLAAMKERAETKSTNNEQEFKTIFSVDSLNDAIKVAIKEHTIDMVVMGTKGATGAKQFLLGSNAVSVINKVRLCPVLLVPDNFEFVTPNQITFPTDFTRIFGNELESIKTLANLHDSTIQILHINVADKLTDTQNNNLEKLKTHLEDYKHSFNWIPEKGKKSQVIASFIEEQNINILTMINYKHDFMEDFIKEPVIKKMGFHAIIPFLAVPSAN